MAQTATHTPGPLTPETAEMICRQRGHAVHYEEERGVRWLIASKNGNRECIPVWNLGQIGERGLIDNYLSRAAIAKAEGQP